jgi:hypothetical protein
MAGGRTCRRGHIMASSVGGQEGGIGLGCPGCVRVRVLTAHFGYEVGLALRLQCLGSVASTERLREAIDSCRDGQQGLGVSQAGEHSRVVDTASAHRLVYMTARGERVVGFVHDTRLGLDLDVVPGLAPRHL